MTVRVQELNGQLVLVIPPEVATRNGLSAGTPIELSDTGGVFRARKASRFPYTIEDLVAGITPEKLHGEWDTGDPVGNEVW